MSEWRVRTPGKMQVRVNVNPHWRSWCGDNRVAEIYNGGAGEATLREGVWVLGLHRLWEELHACPHAQNSLQSGLSLSGRFLPPQQRAHGCARGRTMEGEGSPRPSRVLARLRWDDTCGNTSLSLRNPQKLVVVTAVTTWVCGTHRGEGSPMCLRFLNPDDSEGGESRAGKGGKWGEEVTTHPVPPNKLQMDQIFNHKFKTTGDVL